MWRLDFRHLTLVGLAVAMLLAPTSAVMAQEGWITHVVEPGEDIFSIGARFGVGVPAIMLANKLPNLDLTVGQKLNIPPATAGDASVPVAPPPSVPQGPAVQEGATTHVVAPGENLFRISLRYGLSVQALAWANGLNNVHLIYVGQRLVIPNQSGAPVPQPPAPQPGPDVPSSPPPASTAGQEIVVVLHEQRVYAYENGQLVRSSLVSTGVVRYPTRVGQFHVYAKYIATLMTGPGYYLPNVPYTMYYSGGYALHGTYWHNNFGHPMSHGCVNMLTSEARWLFEWAPVGTLVTVRA
jgi:lipoprotein-anchoring transpeptidase ErfK/SrfK